jgi:hypothetical protein
LGLVHVWCCSRTCEDNCGVSARFSLHQAASRASCCRLLAKEEPLRHRGLSLSPGQRLSGHY